MCVQVVCTIIKNAIIVGIFFVIFLRVGPSFGVANVCLKDTKNNNFSKFALFSGYF